MNTNDRITLGAYRLAKDLGLETTAANINAIYHALGEAFGQGEEHGINLQQAESRKAARLAYMRERVVKRREKK